MLTKPVNEFNCNGSLKKTSNLINNQVIEKLKMFSVLQEKSQQLSFFFSVLHDTGGSLGQILDGSAKVRKSY